MKTYLRWLAVLVVLLTAFVFIPVLSAQEDEDFISISPVDQKDTGTMMDSGAVEGQAVAVKPTAEPAATEEAVEAKPAEPKKAAAEKLANVEKILTLDLADRSEIRIVTSSRVRYKATELAPPPNTRILVQLTKCGVKGSTINVGKGGIDKVRSAPHNTTAWVVIDLQERLKWKARDDGEVIVIEIPKGGTAPKNYAEEAPKTVASGSGMIYRVIDVAGKNMGKKTRVIITTDGPVKYRVKKDSANKQVVLDVLEAVSIWQKGNFTMDGSSVSTVNLREDKASKTVSINLGLSDNLPYTVTRDQNQILVEVDNSAASGKIPKKKLDLYQKISINIQDASLPGVLRLLSTQSGFEFAVSPSVTNARPVTIREDDQTLDQVLRDILIPQDMFYEINDNIIKIGSIAEIKAAKKLGNKQATFYYPKTMMAADLKSLLDMRLTKEPLMDMAIQVDGAAGANRLMLVGVEDDVVKAMSMINTIDRGKGSTTGEEAIDDSSAEEGFYQLRVYKLNNMRINAEAGNQYEEGRFADLKTTFDKMKTEKGFYEFDRRTSSIIVNDIPMVHRKIAKMIKKIDIKVSQVTIEAKIYEINVNSSQDIGVDWTGKTKDNQPYIQGDVQVGAAAALGTVGGLFNIGLLQNGFDLNAYLMALESQRKATLLSSPKITVEESQPANITMLRGVYYEEQSIITSQSGPPTVASVFKRIDLPLSLNVMCKVTKENKINMFIKLNVEKIVESGRTSGPPDISRQQANTYINTGNNETVVLGGLMSDKVVESEDKIPFLGDLPLLGNLFKGTKKSKEKVELVLFLTPTLVED